MLVEGNINAAKYKQMLEDYLLSYLQELGIESYIFRDDNATCHSEFSSQMVN